jgi:hypothetical protein
LNLPICFSRDTGLVDHSQKGIYVFLEQPQCNQICRGLELQSLSLPKEVDIEIEESDDE